MIYCQRQKCRHKIKINYSGPQEENEQKALRAEKAETLALAFLEGGLKGSMQNFGGERRGVKLPTKFGAFVFPVSELGNLQGKILGRRDYVS